MHLEVEGFFPVMRNGKYVPVWGNIVYNVHTNSRGYVWRDYYFAPCDEDVLVPITRNHAHNWLKLTAEELEYRCLILNAITYAGGDVTSGYCPRKLARFIAEYEKTLG